MKKLKTLLCILLLLETVACSGNGITKEDYDKAISERDMIQAQLDDLTDNSAKRERSSKEQVSSNNEGVDAQQYIQNETPVKIRFAGPFAFLVPKSWKEEVKNYPYYYFSDSAFLFTSVTDMGTYYADKTNDTVITDFLTGLKESGISLIDQEKINVNGIDITLLEGDMTTENGIYFVSHIYLLINKSHLVYFSFSQANGIDADFQKDIDRIVDSITLIDSGTVESKSADDSDSSQNSTASSEALKQEPKPSQNETTPTDSSSSVSATIGQMNALSKAKSYLNYSAFSYEGLIKQLEFEEFPYEEAVYGADHCGADWNEQAARKAKDYLAYSSFSREKLINQLEYEGFTHEQAVYGAEVNGY